MSKTLLLLRHGKSDWSVAVDDFDRPLKKRGKKAATRIGKWLRAQSLTPDSIVSSPAVRAKSTAEKVADQLDIDRSAIRFDERLYQADLNTMRTVLSSCCSGASVVLIVGHNPDLETLLNFLVDGIETPEDGKLLATATLAVLTMPDDWTSLSENCARLESITRAAWLS
ncbi:MAG: hypothetical protein Kow0065_09830 [Methylomicrobium sp.]